MDATRPRRGSTKGKRPGSGEPVTISVYFDKALHKRAKLAAAKLDLSLSQWLRQAARRQMQEGREC